MKKPCFDVTWTFPEWENTCTTKDYAGEYTAGAILSYFSIAKGKDGQKFHLGFFNSTYIMAEKPPNPLDLYIEGEQ